MRKLEIVTKVLADVLVAIGFFIILTTAGTSDYMTEIGEYYPLSDIIEHFIVGAVLLLPRLGLEIFDYVLGD